MIILFLIVLGLALGSFVNALVWRVHEQAKRKKNPEELSIVKGRSMCPHCKHELAAKDLVPVLSWLALKGKCRYCSKPISIQYPLVELGAAILFVASYVWWPAALNGSQKVSFCLWLVLLTGFIALTVYDLRWKLLPDRLMYPLAGVAAVFTLISVATASNPAIAVMNLILAVAIGGGVFYSLFQVSNGRWIGGGDVKLGWLLGLVVGTPGRSVLFIFVAALAGTAVSLPLIAAHRAKRTTTVPFGPFLIFGAIVTQLFGHSILHWYQFTILGLR